MTIRNSVHQGSTLGPLFLLYINYIQYHSELISIVLFADDTNILYTCLKINEIIQVEINNKITDWLHECK